MIILEDVFKVERLDPDGKKFDKVSRIEARSERFDMFMHLDGNRKSIADKYEYIMHGKLYKISEDDPGRASKSSVKGVKAEIYVSYGGLLMMLRGDPSNLNQFDLDQRLFLCIRKL
ncbi:hypothetical protein NL676_019249 [Syzygium grande]|nr:hypothetical protein NL676_019249 [Syzygium grande]